MCLLVSYIYKLYRDPQSSLYALHHRSSTRGHLRAAEMVMGLGNWDSPISCLNIELYGYYLEYTF